METLNEPKTYNSDPNNKRFYFGLFLIALGGFWVLERMDLIPDFLDDILISWQMLLIGIGVFSFIGGNRTAGTILIVIGSFFLIDDVLEIPFELRKLIWPFMIIGFGVLLIFTQRRKTIPSVSPGVKDGLDYFDDFVVFGGREIMINSKNFHGGKITTIFGGAEYDLRDTNLTQNGAIIDCVSIFGGCGFKIPGDWKVKNEVSTIFGAFTDKRGSSLGDYAYDPSKTLIIKGFSAFGGVEVKYK
jgi:predicted membrane protein